MSKPFDVSSPVHLTLHERLERRWARMLRKLRGRLFVYVFAVERPRRLDMPQTRPIYKRLPSAQGGDIFPP